MKHTLPAAVSQTGLRAKQPLPGCPHQPAKLFAVFRILVPFIFGILATTNGYAQLSTVNSPSELTVSNNEVFYRAQYDQHGSELWKISNSLSKAVLVKDINPGAAGSDPENLTDVNGTLFFAARSNGYLALWKSNGTKDGTVEVSRIGEGTRDDYGQRKKDFVNANGRLFYTENINAFHSFSLSVSDGTPAGTRTIKDNIQYPGSYNHGFKLVGVGNMVFFVAYDPEKGVELWKSDGTAAGTKVVKDIAPGLYGSDPYNLTNVNGQLFFMVGESLWKSDGTESGTLKVKDLQTLSYIGQPVAIDGILYFSVGNQLWKSDGTENGTVMIKVLNGAPSEFTKVGSVIFFVTGDILWKTNGTSAGTQLVKDRIPASYLTAGGNTLYFMGRTDAHGYELWKSDGTAIGTVMVKDIYEGNKSGAPIFLSALNNKLYFIAETKLEQQTWIGTQAWRTDGTTQGTELIYPERPIPYYAIGSFMLVNADTDKDLQILEDSALIDYSAIGTKNINIRANPAFLSSPLGSVVFEVDGVVVRKENIPSVEILVRASTTPGRFL